MTLFVMAPTFQAAWDNGVKPKVENKISQQDGYTRTTEPFRIFMKANVERRTSRFSRTSRRSVSAMRKSRARRPPRPHSGVHGLGTAAWLRNRLPGNAAVPRHRSCSGNDYDGDGHDDAIPSTISMPFKILFFILIDGWNLLVGGLVRSFH